MSFLGVVGILIIVFAFGLATGAFAQFVLTRYFLRKLKERD